MSAFSSPNSQLSDNLCNLVMKCSAVSSESCRAWLKVARSNTRFFRTPKYSSNLLSTRLYTFLCSSLMFVVDNMSSASSPMQYIRPLTWRSSEASESPLASRYRSKRLFHFLHSSGFENWKAAGGCSWRVAILALLTPCTIISR